MPNLIVYFSQRDKHRPWQVVLHFKMLIFHRSTKFLSEGRALHQMQEKGLLQSAEKCNTESYVKLFLLILMF